MITNRQRLSMELVFNILLVLLDAFVILMLMFNNGDGFSFTFLMYFTHYSSLCLLVSSALQIYGTCLEIREKKRRIIYPIRVFRLMSVSASILVTFVVVFLLIPLANFEGVGKMLFTKTNFLEYIVCPLIAFVSFIHLGDYREFEVKEAAFATLPTLLYAIVTTTLNAFKVIRGPYPFLYVYEQPVWLSCFFFIVILAISFMISNVLVILSHKDSLVTKIRKKGTDEKRDEAS